MKEMHAYVILRNYLPVAIVHAPDHISTGAVIDEYCKRFKVLRSETTAQRTAAYILPVLNEPFLPNCCNSQQV